MRSRCHHFLIATLALASLSACSDNVAGPLAANVPPHSDTTKLPATPPSEIGNLPVRGGWAVSYLRVSPLSIPAKSQLLSAAGRSVRVGVPRCRLEIRILCLFRQILPRRFPSGLHF